MNAKKTVVLTAALAVLTLVSTAHAQIAFRSSSSAFISGGGGTPVAPTLRSWAAASLGTGPTRFYLHQNTADVNPPTLRGNWRDGGTTCCWASGAAPQTKYRLGKLTRYKPDQAGQLVAVTRGLIDVNPGHVLIQKLVSDPLPVAQTISGTLDWVITAQESSASQNAFNQLHVYVLREPDTLVGTLLNNYAELSTSTNEWPTSPLGRGPAGGTPATLTAVAAQAGDRIVIEAGWVGYSTRADNAGMYHAGVSPISDATPGGGSGYPLWLQFSQDLFGGRILKPTGTVAGDVMIASISVTPNTATITPPLGWTPVGSRIDNTTAPTSSLFIYQRTADASDSSVTGYVFSPSGATGAVGIIRSFSGVDTANPIDVQNGQATPTGYDHATPDVTTTVANTLLVASHAVSSGGRTWTAPTGMAENYDLPMSTVSTEGSTVVQATAGATGAKTASVCSVCTGPGTTHILALRGVGGGGGSNTLTINKPAGVAQNDVMIASITVGPSTVTITAAGWTLVRRTDNANGTSNSLAVYSLVAGAAEPASYNWTFSAGNTGAAGGIMAFSGADPVLETDSGVNTASGTASATNGVTTALANTMIITSHGIGSASTWTPPTGMAETVDATGGSAALEMNYVLQSAAGASGTKTATATVVGTGNAHILALRRVLGAFNAFETSTAAGATSGFIKTKVAGTTVNVAIASLNAAKTAVATYYVGTMRIEVLDASNNSAALDVNGCRSTWTVIQTLSPDLTFAASDSGRKNTSFSVANSYPNARIRMTSPVLFRLLFRLQVL